MLPDLLPLQGRQGRAVSGGPYTDTLRKVDGEWRFERRKVNIDGHV